MSSLADEPEVSKNIDESHHKNGEPIDEKGLEAFEYELHGHVVIDSPFDIPKEERLAEVDSVTAMQDGKYLERFEYEQNLLQIDTE